jgi:hypothetical protein
VTATRGDEMGKKRKVVLREHGDSRGVIVEVDGEEVASANYDEHGWSGIDAVENTVMSICRTFGIAMDDRRPR